MKASSAKNRFWDNYNKIDQAGPPFSLSYSLNKIQRIMTKSNFRLDRPKISTPRNRILHIPLVHVFYVNKENLLSIFHNFSLYQATNKTSLDLHGKTN